MVLSDICIRRPVLATVLSLVVVLVGIVSFGRLTVREYPNIDSPVVLVETIYRGASAEVLESQVTRVLEESIAGIEGIDYLRSITRPERSLVVVQFKLSRDPEAAANDVRDRVSRVRGRLPDEIEDLELLAPTDEFLERGGHRLALGREVPQPLGFQDQLIIQLEVRGMAAFLTHYSVWWIV